MTSQLKTPDENCTNEVDTIRGEECVARAFMALNAQPPPAKPSTAPRRQTAPMQSHEGVDDTVDSRPFGKAQSFVIAMLLFNMILIPVLIFAEAYRRLNQVDEL